MLNAETISPTIGFGLMGFIVAYWISIPVDSNYRRCACHLVLLDG